MNILWQLWTQLTFGLHLWAETVIVFLIFMAWGGMIAWTALKNAVLEDNQFVARRRMDAVISITEWRRCR